MEECTRNVQNYLQTGQPTLKSSWGSENVTFRPHEKKKLKFVEFTEWTLFYFLFPNLRHKKNRKPNQTNRFGYGFVLNWFQYFSVSKIGRFISPQVLAAVLSLSFSYYCRFWTDSLNKSLSNDKSLERNEQKLL